MCSASWHAGKTCEEHGKSLVKRAGTSASLSGMFNAGNDSVLIIGGIEIKRCPMCSVPIERDTGCAQMMCKRCKHVFCWYCLKSLDVSVFLAAMTYPITSPLNTSQAYLLSSLNIPIFRNDLDFCLMGIDPASRS